MFLYGENTVREWSLTARVILSYFIRVKSAFCFFFTLHYSFNFISKQELGVKLRSQAGALEREKVAGLWNERRCRALEREKVAELWNERRCVFSYTRGLVYYIDFSNFQFPISISSGSFFGFHAIFH